MICPDPLVDHLTHFQEEIKMTLATAVSIIIATIMKWLTLAIIFILELITIWGIEFFSNVP